MQDMIDWIEEVTGYEVMTVPEEIDHSRTASKKGYVPKHKKYTVTLLQDVPRRSGVYIFFDKSGAVAYIGRASNLRDRIRGHLTGIANTKDSKEVFHRVAYFQCLEYDARPLERHLIETLQPYVNVKA